MHWSEKLSSASEDYSSETPLARVSSARRGEKGSGLDHGDDLCEIQMIPFVRFLSFYDVLSILCLFERTRWKFVIYSVSDIFSAFFTGLEAVSSRG